MYTRLCVLISLGYMISLSAISVVCEYGDIRDTLDLNHLEPLSCATYGDLAHSNEENTVLIARLVSSAHGNTHINYVDAHRMHEALFDQNVPSPEHAPKILFNPVNKLPLVENITYFAVHEDHARYVGTLTDVYKQTPAGEYIQAFLDAHYSDNPLSRTYGQYALAQCYHTGSGVARNMHAALYWYSKIATQKSDAELNHHLLYALGSVYEVCSDIPDHAINALTYYKKAAQETTNAYVQGAALCALGNWYSSYIYDGVTAVEYYTQASKCGDVSIQARAYTALGDMYRTGFTNLPKNYAHACNYYQHALKGVHDSALQAYIQYNSATVYYQGGFGLEKDYQKAAPLFEQVARGSSGTYLLPAALALGELYRVGGYGISADARRAHEWYSMVVEKNDASYARMAMLGLAELYRTDDSTIPRDRVKAQNLYNQVLAMCTDGDCLQPMIYNGLASLYCFSCDQISADPQKARAYYQQAYTQTHNRQARAVAAHGLATLYYHGAPGSARDVPHAVTYYTYVAEQSDDLYLQAHAHQILGELFVHGYGNVRGNIDNAIAHLQQAAKQKVNVDAQNKAQHLLQEIHEQSLNTASRIRQALHG